MTLDIKPLADTLNGDALFQNYQKQNKDKLRDTFRLPPIYTGSSTDYNRATAQTARVITEEQIFCPERKKITSKFNNIINNELENDKENLSTLSTINGMKLYNDFKSTKYKNKVEFSDNHIKIIDNQPNNSVILIHNHHDGTVPSPEDLLFLLKHKSIKYLFAIGHNKTIHIIYNDNRQKYDYTKEDWERLLNTMKFAIKNNLKKVEPKATKKEAIIIHENTMKKIYEFYNINYICGEDKMMGLDNSVLKINSMPEQLDNEPSSESGEGLTEEEILEILNLDNGIFREFFMLEQLDNKPSSGSEQRLTEEEIFQILNLDNGILEINSMSEQLDNEPSSESTERLTEEEILQILENLPQELDKGD